MRGLVVALAWWDGLVLPTRVGPMRHRLQQRHHLAGWEARRVAGERTRRYWLERILRIAIVLHRQRQLLIDQLDQIASWHTPSLSQLARLL